MPNETELPDWPKDAFAAREYTQLPCEWATAMFNSDNITIELYRLENELGMVTHRALATVDGELYFTDSRSFLRNAADVARFCDFAEHKLQYMDSE